jgi:undecaprenyl-diphosphatase
MTSSWGEKILRLDAELSQNISIAEKRGSLRRLAIIFAHSGDSWFWILGLGLLWWLGSGVWRTMAITMLVGILITAGLVFVLKFTIRRPRPAGEWGSIYRKTDPHSFPSGHAARAAMLALVAIGLAPIWLGILMVAWAVLVISARVAMGVHYLSDVLVGALIGITTGFLALFIQSTLSL